MSDGRTMKQMGVRHFEIVQALARHALYALAALPKDHPQQVPLRWQVQRLEDQLRADGDTDRADKIGRLGKWFDDGAVVSTDTMILSEAARRLLRPTCNDCGKVPIDSVIGTVSISAEFYVGGIRYDAGDYIIKRVGPAKTDAEF